MKIAILNDNFAPRSAGGSDIIALTTALALQKNGHEVVVVTTVRSQKDAGVYIHEGLRVHAIASSYPFQLRAYISLWNPRVVHQVKGVLTEFKPDVVHAHNVHQYLSYRSLIVAKKLGSNVVLTCHDVMTFNYSKFIDFINPNDPSVLEKFNYRVSAWHQFVVHKFRYNPFRNYCIKHILKRYVDHVVAVSDALKDALDDNGIQNVSVIHNGIDVGEWEESASNVIEFKKKHQLGERIVLFGGRLSNVKGGAKLLQAFSHSIKKLPDAQLLVIGSKDVYAEKMLHYADSLGLAKNIVFTGWMSGHELHQAYHAASIVVVPSLCFDSFPTMNLEAMACSKPVIATCFGGSREAVIDGQTGYIINPFDVSVLGVKITALLEVKYESEKFGRAGYERVVAEFSLPKQIKEYETLFGKTKYKS